MKRILIAAGIILVLTACKKETGTPPSTSLYDIIAKTWIIKDAKENGTATSDFNGNTISFTRGGTYTAVSPLDTVSGSWQFNAQQTHVIFDNNTKPDEVLSDWEILELNDQRFRWRWIYTQESV